MDFKATLERTRNARTITSTVLICISALAFLGVIIATLWGSYKSYRVFGVVEGSEFLIGGLTYFALHALPWGLLFRFTKWRLLAVIAIPLITFVILYGLLPSYTWAELERMGREYQGP